MTVKLLHGPGHRDLGELIARLIPSFHPSSPVTCSQSCLFYIRVSKSSPVPFLGTPEEISSVFFFWHFCPIFAF